MRELKQAYERYIDARDRCLEELNSDKHWSEMRVVLDEAQFALAKMVTALGEYIERSRNEDAMEDDGR